MLIFTSLLICFSYRCNNFLDNRYFETDILSMNLTKLGTQFQAVYMDPPLLLPGEVPSPGKITIEQLVFAWFFFFSFNFHLLAESFMV